MDTTTEFLTAFFSQKFSSFEEFHSQLKEFEKLTGSIYIIQSSKFLPQDHPDRGRLVYSALQYSCYHYGVCQSMVTPRRNQRNSRGSCGSRISLSAMNGKLWITKYHMIHNHSPLPETVKIDQSVRRLQVQESGKDELVISDDVQVVLDDIVDQLPKHNISLDSSRGSPGKTQSRPVQERKAAARDRLAARTKKARGLKLAPCLRRLAELAAAGSGPDFHKHLGELETLVEIWKHGGISSLASGSSSGVYGGSNSVTPSQTDSIAIAKAVENLFRKQKAIDNSTGTVTGATVKLPGLPPKAAQIVTPVVTGSTVSVIQTSPQPVVLKQALGSQSGAFVNSSGVVTLPSTAVTTLPKDVVIADAGSGQLQLINSASIITAAGQKGDNGVAEGQPILGYVIQPMASLSGGQTIIPTAAMVTPTNFVPIAPKLPVSESPMQSFQPIPPPPPKVVRPPMPICKPKVMKPRGRQPKLKSGLGEGLLAVPEGPAVTRFVDNGQPKPWTPMIMEGDSCSYFLFVEDANYYYSPEEDAWLPLDQRTMAVDA
ncbi:hypothetical protein TSMEX_007161 [Taenia solium]|eukprot:TsM_000127800 transcript=TsM_000127800 gene=TsM_000127800